MFAFVFEMSCNFLTMGFGGVFAPQNRVASHGQRMFRSSERSELDVELYAAQTRQKLLRYTEHRQTGCLVDSGYVVTLAIRVAIVAIHE